jgi:nucleoside-diphosphate-sugar epimerase
VRLPRGDAGRPGHASGRLTLHACDLDAVGCFDAIFPGCHGVVHSAAQLGRKNPQALRAGQYVTTAEHLIESVEKSGTVGRVVYTSSIAAVISELDFQALVRRPVLYEDRYPEETDARFEQLDATGYSVGKVIEGGGPSSVGCILWPWWLHAAWRCTKGDRPIGKVNAEKLFAEAAARSGGRWDAITCNPSDNVGPIQVSKAPDVGPEVGPTTSAFYSCIPT